MGHGYYGYGSGMGGGAVLLHLLFGALLFIILLAIAVILVRFALHGGRRRHWMVRGDAPLELLKERYAKGEIDKREFEEKKKDLAA